MDEATREALGRLDDENSRQNRRLAELEQSAKEMRDIVIAVHELATNMQHMLDEQKKQGARLDKIESEPAQKWRRVGDKAIDTAVGLVFGAIVTGMVMLIAQHL